MHRRRRRRLAVLMAVVMAVGWAGTGSASADEVVSGSCVVQLRAHRDDPAGQHMTVSTNVSSVCVGDDVGRIDLSGELVPVVPGIQFTCRENLGKGSATLSVYTDPADTTPAIVVDDLDFQAHDVDGAVEAVTIRHTAQRHLVGSFEGVRSPNVVQACSQGTNPVVWAGVYTFEIVLD